MKPTSEIPPDLYYCLSFAIGLNNSTSGLIVILAICSDLTHCHFSCCGLVLLHWSLWLLVVVVMGDIMIGTHDICALNYEFCLNDPLLEIVIVIKHLNDA